MTTKKIGLALGGGGARGLCHIAFITALDELGVKPAVISGTSIGAIVGAFYAAGFSGEMMKALIERIKFKEIGKMMDFSIARNSVMLKGKGVEKFIRANIPATRFEDLQIPLKVVATDFWRRKEVVFNAGDLIGAIRASISIPAVFRPVTISDTVLVDGGMVNPLPYDIIRKECDLLVAIDVSGERNPKGDNLVPTMWESLASSFLIMQSAIIENKMKIQRPDIYIKPALRGFHLFQFDRHKEIMEGVQQDVVLFKQQLEACMRRRFSIF